MPRKKNTIQELMAEVPSAPSLLDPPRGRRSPGTDMFADEVALHEGRVAKGEDILFFSHRAALLLYD